MNLTKTVMMAGAFLIVAALAAPVASLSPVETLGKKFFFDIRLSVNDTQSSGGCHGS